MRRFLALGLALLALSLGAPAGLAPASAVPVSWSAGAAFAFVPVNHSFAGGTTAATETIPIGASQIIIEDCAAGAAGGGGDNLGGDFGGGGGSGGYVKKTFSLTPTNWGQTFTVTVKNGSPQPGANTSGADPGSSTVVNGTFGTATSLTAGGGATTGGKSFGAGQAAGVGGSASGGDMNTTGNPGTAGGGTHLGGAGVAGIQCTTGVGGNGNINLGQAGGNGAAWFEYS